MRDTKLQRYVQQQKSLKVTKNAKFPDKHINETSIQFLPTISSNYHVNARKVLFPSGSFVSMSSTHKLGMKFSVI